MGKSSLQRARAVCLSLTGWASGFVLMCLGTGGTRDQYLTSELWASWTGCLTPVLTGWCLTDGSNSQSLPVVKYFEHHSWGHLRSGSLCLEVPHLKGSMRVQGREPEPMTPSPLFPPRRTTTGPLAAPPASCVTATPRAPCLESVTLRMASVHASQGSLGASATAVTTRSLRSPPMAVKVKLP